ncbi:hypothetical protein [Roseicella aquatilis]|uniref:hypothetical protein n=1 Tax=Roseicella aquatilis TaxID=2527868 RepID=UPI0019800CC3|nr:hypothetical protein [Roseicella aquatilis]
MPMWLALVERCGQANAAFMRGDMRAYLALISHADDYTLMAPFGGTPVHGALLPRRHDHVGDDAELRVRQRAEAGGLPEQDWSLRVTWSSAAREPSGSWRTAMPIPS